MSDHITNSVEIKAVKDIIDSVENNCYFYVPLYQRGYRWSKDDARKLIDDVYSNYKRNEEKDTAYKYSLQALTLKKVDDNFLFNGKTYTKYNVIDGQQRLTTLAIILCALNDLEKGINIQNTNKDLIQIGYERNGGSLDIRGFCDKIFFSVTASNTFDPEKIKTSLTEDLTIDEQFVLNNYLYCYKFFRDKIETKEYFNFIPDRYNNGPSHRIESLYSMFKDYTSVIWYVTDEKNERAAFENINRNKIELTGSELVKALFMNPENYLSGESSDQIEETIKIRQINIGARWDEIEKQLHSESFWHFFPHNDKLHANTRFDAVIDFFVYKKEVESGTSREAIIGYFENNPRFSFDSLWVWITADLKKAEEDLERSGAAGRSQKADVMNSWWNKLCDIYDWYYMIYNTHQLGETGPDPKGHIPSFAVYHRVALLQLLKTWHLKYVDVIREDRQYFYQFELGVKIINKLEKCSKRDIKNVLNSMLVDDIEESWKSGQIKVFSTKFKDDKGYEVVLGVDKTKCDTLDKKIRALVYSSNNFLMSLLLVIDSLHVLEKTGGTLSRFDFLDFDSQDKWVKEHIFARGTDFGEILKTPEEKKDFLERLVDKSCGWENYLEFKFADIVCRIDPDAPNDPNFPNYSNNPKKPDDPSVPKNPCVEILKGVKEQYLERIEKARDNYYKMPNNLNTWEDEVNPLLDNNGSLVGYDADTGKPIVYCMPDVSAVPEGFATAVDFLKDNSMGNMSILTGGENSGVKCGGYKEKTEKIAELIDDGKFIPMNAVNVFSGKYCDPKFDYKDYWYPCHRKIYLAHLIDHVCDYLGFEMVYKLKLKQDGDNNGGA